jgi:hypothetical protein
MKPWFVVKRYGVGLSPSGWGWLLTFAYVALLGIALIGVGRFGPVVTMTAIAVLTVIFFVVMALTSDHKPWRWRWGEDDP